MQLYEKHISENGRTTYREHIPPQPWVPSPDDEITDGQLVTLTASLGVTLLMIQQQMLPEHANLRRKIKKVEDAILDLFSGHGKQVEREMVDYWYQCWDETMRRISACGRGQS